MRRMKPTFAAAALAIACVASPQRTDHQRIESTTNVWQIVTPTGSCGSGVPIYSSGTELYLITAGHIWDAAPFIPYMAKHTNGATLGAGYLISRHPTLDVAIIAFPVSSTVPYHTAIIDSSPLNPGQAVYGAGWGHAQVLWLTLGIISGRNYASMPIKPGDSGGGLFDDQGRLLALMLARTGCHQAWVLPMHDIRHWLSQIIPGFLQQDTK